jgi:hypothetical protein
VTFQKQGAAMSILRYQEGNLFDFVPARLPAHEQAVYVPHVCNNAGLWGSGFVVPLAARFPQARTEYFAAMRRAGIEPGFPTLPLGLIQYIEVVGQRVTVVNMIAQLAPGSAPVSLSYAALEKCMANLGDLCRREAFNNPTIHAPLFGCHRAGGSWSLIESMIQRLWIAAGIPVTLYFMPGQLPPGFQLPEDQACCVKTSAG